MVESQRRQLRDWKPLCLGCIILTTNLNGYVNHDEIRHGDCSSARITVHFGVCTYLLKLGDNHPRFLFQLTSSTLLRGFIHIHEPARECPVALERFITPLDKQHPWMHFSGDDHTVCRDCRSRIFVCICHFNKMMITSQPPCESFAASRRSRGHRSLRNRARCTCFRSCPDRWMHTRWCYPPAALPSPPLCLRGQQ